MNRKRSSLLGSSKPNDSPKLLLKIWFGVIIMLVGLLWSKTSADMSVTLAWDPNPEPDIAAYVIYYGITPRMYAHATNVGNVTCASVHGLEECTVYYFAITAVSTAGLESDFSDEVTNWTHCVSIRLRYSTNATGPWIVLYQTNIPKSAAGFFSTQMRPGWPNAIYRREWCSNGVPIKYVEDTNIVDTPPPPPPQ